MIEIDATSYVPPFEQIRAQLAAQIHAGTLPAGQRLPTVRRLAHDLGLAVNTVARAYRELEGAGLITTRGRAGTTVAATTDTRHRLQAAARRYAETIHELGASENDAVTHLHAALHDHESEHA
jgi:DNA-binding transcriptional regulator YhcF (GntR family)